MAGTQRVSFSDQLRDNRKRLVLTQAGADAVLDTCRGQVAAWESGRNTPHILTQEGALARLSNRKTMPDQLDTDKPQKADCPSGLCSAWVKSPKEVLTSNDIFKLFEVHAALQACRINIKHCPPGVDLWAWIRRQPMNPWPTLSARAKSAHWHRILTTWARRANVSIQPNAKRLASADEKTPTKQENE